uniref:18S rRNA (guanine(1575)-N(7))-methyltransferase Bud23 C-terminal domain-containing protein n=2 Tax=Oryza nivara TaxID=4536 RepID=A0A0E0GE85_ORYNI
MVTHGGGGGGGARTIWDNEAAAAAGVMRRSPRCVGEFIGDPLLGRDIVLGLWDSRPISRVSLHRRPMKSPVERRSVVGTLGESRREHTTDLCGGGEERRGEKPRRRQRGERMPRPEVQAPPEIFYNDSEARKYTTSSRIIEIQSRITERALELLALPNDGVPKLLLDIGCGSGLSGETLTEQGHHWIGYDISKSMLDVALEREAEGDLLLADMGQGLGLRPGVIDGAISISAVQWLCNADKSCHNPRLRLKAFFGSLYRCLARGARAVLQFYADNVKQSEMIVTAAMRAGFAGGVVVDWPHSSKAKKSYLVLTCGPPSLNSSLPKGKGQDGAMCSDDDESDDGSGDEDGAQTVGIYERNRPKKRQKTKKNCKGKAWLLNKKEQLRRRGREVPADTKYTGRKRKSYF